MKDVNLLDRKGIYLAILVLNLSWLLFFLDTGGATSSFFAALMAAGLAWGAYILLRWLIIALSDR